MNETLRAGLAPPILGNQLVVDFYDCGCDGFDNLEWVENVMIEAANRANATIVDVVFHKFNPIGISGIVVIAESHLAIHTWPEHRFAAIDVFTCGSVLDSEAAISYLATQFRCGKRSVTKINRGISDSLLTKSAVAKDIFAARDRRVSDSCSSSKFPPIED